MSTQTIAQQLNVTKFPFIIDTKEIRYYEDKEGWSRMEFNERGSLTYSEDSTGFWRRKEYNKEGDEIYLEESTGYWRLTYYNEQREEIYLEDSNNYWEKREYNEQNNFTYLLTSTGCWEKMEYDEFDIIYHETHDGVLLDVRPKLELTLEQEVESLIDKVEMLLKTKSTQVDNF